MTSKYIAGLRHSRYYADVLLQTDRLYDSGTNGIENGLQLFDLNWRNIELGQTWAMQWYDRDEKAATLVSEFPERGVHCLYLRQSPKDRLKWLEVALAVTQARGMEIVEGTLHGKLGLALTEIGEYEQAFLHYSKRLAIATKLGDDEGLGEGLCNLGILYDNMNLLEQAHACYQRAIELAQSIFNSKILEVSIGNLGLLHLKEGAFLKARECFARHLELACKNGDSWSQSNALTNMGIASYKLQDYEQAMKSIHESLTINKRLGDLEGEAKNQGYVGLIYSALNNFEGASDAYQKRLEIAKKLQDHHGEAIGYWNLGEVLIRQKKIKAGLAYMKKCLDYEENTADPSWQDDLKIYRSLQEQYSDVETLE